MSMISAGSRADKDFPKYAGRIRAFDWDDFYTNWGGEQYFEWLRLKLETIADVVLIDSRTGVTEMSGVCTYQLADAVVMFVVPNQQNLDGTKMIAQSLNNPGSILEIRQGRPISILPVPSRVERAEAAFQDSFAKRFEETLGKFLPEDLRFEKSAFDDLMIPHVPFYAYLEKIAIRESGHSGVSLNEAYEGLAITLAQLAPEAAELRKIYVQDIRMLVRGGKPSRLIHRTQPLVRSKAALKTTFSWLHLTDLHQGTQAHDWLWPGVKEQFFKDLQRLYDKCGPWDLVLFTGDLTQCGSADEFRKLDTLLEQLWDFLYKLDPSSIPLLLTVPGNHDLVRSDKKDPAVKILKQWHNDRDIQNEFWENADSFYREAVAKAFANYSAWQEQRFSNIPGYHAGILPGDFSVSIEKNGAKLGIAGLNTAFLQLTDSDYEGKLALHARQLHEACGGNGIEWAKQHHACLLLTHHPSAWLDSESQQHLHGEITAHSLFAVHLCGHMHKAASWNVAEGGADVRRVWQGRSLFGLEFFGQHTERQHGYSAGRIELDGKQGMLTFWPRETRLQGKQRKIAPDYSLDLTDEQHTPKLNFKLHQPYASPDKDSVPLIVLPENTAVVDTELEQPAPKKKRVSSPAPKKTAPSPIIEKSKPILLDWRYKLRAAFFAALCPIGLYCALPNPFRELEDIGMDFMIWLQQGMVLDKDTMPFIFLDIDEPTYQAWEKPPITPRDKLLTLIDFAVKAKAAVIIVDIDVSQPGSDSGEMDKADNELQTYLEEYQYSVCVTDKSFPRCPQIIFARPLPWDESGKHLKKKENSFLDEAIASSKNIDWAFAEFVRENQQVRRFALWWATCAQPGNNEGEVIESVELLTAALLVAPPTKTLTEVKGELQQELHQFKSQGCVSSPLLLPQGGRKRLLNFRKAAIQAKRIWKLVYSPLVYSGAYSTN